MNALAPISADQQWFLLRTEASKERLASNLLRQRGFDVYCPMRTVWRHPSRYARRTKVARQIALFPRYIFVELPNDNRWLELFEPNCVLSWVGFCGTPYRIANVLIDEWRERFGEAMSGPKFQRWMKSNKEFLAGELVVVVEGVFADPLKPVKVEEIQGKAAKIWSNLFGGRFAFIPLDHLERVE